MVEHLHNLGVSASKPCDEFNQTPFIHAKRLDDIKMIELLKLVTERDIKAAFFFYNNYKRFKARKSYSRKLKSILFLQQLFKKGFFKAKRKNQFPVKSDFDHFEGDVEDNDQEAPQEIEINKNNDGCFVNKDEVNEKEEIEDIEDDDEEENDD